LQSVHGKLQTRIANRRHAMKGNIIANLGCMRSALSWLVFSLLSLREVSSWVCGSNLILYRFYFDYANGEYHYNAKDDRYEAELIRKIYIWHPTGSTSWVIGFDPDVPETGGLHGHFGWCGEPDLRNCHIGDWWFWIDGQGWHNDPDATIVHSEPEISGMTFLPELNGQWGHHDSYMQMEGGRYTEMYSKTIWSTPVQIWYLFPVDDAWSIGYKLATETPSYQIVLRCDSANLLRCWQGTWNYLPLYRRELAAKVYCTPMMTPEGRSPGKPTLNITKMPPTVERIEG